MTDAMPAGDRNLVYTTDAIARHFGDNRVTWAQFYPSERALIERLGLGAAQSVLDIGCASGGLGLALAERFGVRNYTGVEINAQAAAAGRALNPGARILHGDILDISARELGGAQFDVVFSLSCIDWNVRFRDMLAVAWSHVRPGGHFVATFRLTTGAGCADLATSYQHINYEGKREGEIAAYVVLNAAELGAQLSELRPGAVLANGYWGKPSATAITPYDQLCFVALAVRKRGVGDATTGPIAFDVDLPREVGALLERQAG